MILEHIFGIICSGLFHNKPVAAMNSFVVIMALSAVAVANAGVFAPSAVVATHGHLVAPGHLAYAGFAAAPYAAHVVVPAGSGLEGQYIPDHLEKLYDDGSYKPEIRALPLAASPYGLVPAGSGLEGQYVHDLTEKLYDDGSYRAEHHFGH